MEFNDVMKPAKIRLCSTQIFYLFGLAGGLLSCFYLDAEKELKIKYQLDVGGAGAGRPPPKKKPYPH